MFAAIALLVGPFAYLAAGRLRRAQVAAVLWAVPLLVYAWRFYLQTYLAVDPGGESAREVTDTAIHAATLWAAAAPRWAPGGWWVVGLANAACAIDLWRLGRNGRTAA